MANYEEMLNLAYSKIKEPESNGDRFEIPKIEGHFEGKKTILTNLLSIASHLRRDPEHIQKFLLRELAVSGQMEGDRLILNNNVPSSKINQKIEQYTKEFVLCKECQKPDTELIKEGRLSFIKCLACGAKHPIRNKI
ncbi:translation initiation factor IF-2 subunit beta [Candidatus Woesearchaeota archaeon]|nr:translation initiation factor IF-2 subunit beta [Candidatus Woesearchaeota archaeon]